MSVALYDNLAQWARSKPQILALHLFGARARGEHKAQSVIELALEFSGVDDEAQQLRNHEARWKQELSALTGVQVVALELRSNRDVVRLPIVTVYRHPES